MDFRECLSEEVIFIDAQCMSTMEWHVSIDVYYTITK